MFAKMFVLEKSKTIQHVSKALNFEDGKPVVTPLSSNHGLCFVTCVQLRTPPKKFSDFRFKKNLFFDLWKKAGHTISIYEKSVTIDLSCNFLFLWNCIKSLWIAFSIYEHLWPAFLVNLGKRQRFMNRFTGFPFFKRFVGSKFYFRDKMIIIGKYLSENSCQLVDFWPESINKKPWAEKFKKKPDKQNQK